MTDLPEIVKTDEEHPEPLAILALEDVEEDAQLIERELRNTGISFTLKRVEDEASYRKMIKEFRPDLILADYSLPSFDGSTALEIALKEIPDAPFIFVSGAMGEELAIDLLKRGATDYVLKNKLSRLSAAVKRALREIREREERWEAEKRLRDSEERYRVLVESTDDSIYMVDAKGTYLFANEKYLSRIGLNRSEVVGRKYGDFHASSQEEELMQNIGKVLESGRSIHYEDAGTEGHRYFLRTLSPVKDPETERIVFVTVVSKDITERKRAEEEIRKARDELEQRVVERTSQLAASNELLRREIEDRKRAEESLKQLNDVLSESVSELESRNREIELLSEMGSLLQACVNTEEAYRVIANSVQKIFASESGSIFLLNPGMSLLESIASWGEWDRLENDFEIKECWALRLGRPYFIQDTESEPVCPHVKNIDSVAAYLDVPMTAHGEILGLLSLRFNNFWKEYSDRTREHVSRHKRQIATTVAENIALSLANFRLRETLYVQSVHDPLTGLCNRRHLAETLERELHRMSRRGLPLGVMMIDIDYFKKVNDTYGHEAGDLFLRELGSFLKSQIRGEDFACRYGGEEFILVLPETTLEITRQRAEQVRREFESLKIVFREQPISGWTLSVGLAVYPDHGLTAEQIIQAADVALYRAKAEGRNCVVSLDPGEFKTEEHAANN
ncbi:MAG TPA: diguanylate cyclase [Syntrophales bacterium]|nr:diguanylate cyclase [Syntrophales bacterium]